MVQNGVIDMKIVTVRIENNDNIINEICELNNLKRETEGRITSQIDEYQQQGFLQILAYIKCLYEDYIKITGERISILDVSNISRTLCICVKDCHVIIDFNYAGTPYCKNTPSRMEAKFINNSITVIKSSREGIQDLLNGWQYIKPEFQKEIEKTYEKKSKKIKKDVSELNYLLKVAKEFKV